MEIRRVLESRGLKQFLPILVAIPWIFFLRFFIWMHASGMGCGGHGGHGGRDEKKKREEGGGHQH